MDKGIISSTFETESTILDRDDINWQYVLTKENPADLGSRGSLLIKFQIFGAKVLLG